MTKDLLKQTLNGRRLTIKNLYNGDSALWLRIWAFHIGVIHMGSNWLPVSKKKLRAKRLIRKITNWNQLLAKHPVVLVNCVVIRCFSYISKLNGHFVEHRTVIVEDIHWTYIGQVGCNVNSVLVEIFPFKFSFILESIR